MKTMERTWSCLLSAIWLVFTLVGCADSGAPHGVESAPNAGSASRSYPHRTLVAASPQDAVSLFLEAVRLGDDQSAGSMLTQLARQKTEQLDMVVAPPGSDTASFQVGQPQMVSTDVARVPSTWTDLDHEGKPRTDDITWTVRRDGGAWRIAGMAAKILKDRPPVELDFENPQEMVRQQQRAEQEGLGQQSRPQEQAQKPQDPFQPGRK